MNEAYVVSQFKKKLLLHRYLVKKIADKTTQGLPDLIAVKNRKVLFLEFKYFEREALPIQFSTFSAIPQLQLMTMYELQQHGANAWYILAYNVPGEKLQFTYASATLMLTAIQSKTGFVIPSFKSLSAMAATLDILCS
jgi:hypothetical protein